jgi:hypothetical protein
MLIVARRRVQKNQEKGLQSRNGMRLTGVNDGGLRSRIER